MSAEEEGKKDSPCALGHGPYHKQARGSASSRNSKVRSHNDLCEHTEPLSKTTRTCSSTSLQLGEFSTCETPKCSHTPTHAAPRWFWHPHRETPQPRACTPLFTTSFPLHHTRHKNQTGKISQDRESTPPAGFSPVPLHTIMSLRLSTSWDQSQEPSPAPKSMLHLTLPWAQGFCPLPPNTRKLHILFLPSKYRIIIKE